MSSVTITRTTPTIAGDYIPTGYPVKFTAVGTDMPSEIFVFKDVGNGKDSIFSNVAAFYELGDLLTETYVLENAELEVTYYRSDELTLILPTIEEVEEISQKILEDVTRLVEDYNNLSDLDLTETYVIT